MKPVWLAFGLACVLQWAAPLWQILSHERVINHGQVVRMVCEAPDPYDLLRGRYLAVRVNPERVSGVPASDAFQMGEDVHAVLKTGNDGVVQEITLSRARPESGPYIRVKTGYVSSQGDPETGTLTVGIKWPFDRLYLNENLAPKADQWYRDNIRSDKPILADLRVLNGGVVLIDLLQDGKSFRSLLETVPKD